MPKQKKLKPIVILWSLISLSLVVVTYSVSDLFRLETMVAQAEQRELHRHFRKLGTVLGSDAADPFAFDGFPADRSPVRAQSGFVPAAFSPPFRPGEFAGSDVLRMPRSLTLNGGWDLMSGLEPAAAHLASSRSRPILDDFKRTVGADAALFGLDGGRAAPFVATLAGTAWLTDEELRRAAAGETIFSERRLGGMEAAILAGPVHDPSGRRIGVAAIAHDRARFTATVGALRTAVIGIGLLLLFVGASIACAVSAKPAEA